MKVRKFRPIDFETYQSWFLDKLVFQHLGSMPDKAWLDYILTDTTGAQYAFLEKEALVGVMGIVFPDKKHPYYYITDIVVQPKLRKKGLGAKMLQLLQNLHPLSPGQSYKAFVDVNNENAQLFFKKLGWQLISATPDKDNMLSFTFKTKQ